MAENPAGRYCEVIVKPQCCGSGWGSIMSRCPVHSTLLAAAMLAGFAWGQPPGFGPPGMNGQGDRKLVKDFDQDGDGRLDAAERKAARASLAKEKAAGTGRKGFGPPPGMFGAETPAKPGPQVAVADAPRFTELPLFSLDAFRTFFLEFEDPDWEAALADFYRTDVQIPATLTVDGVKYPNVGVGFRGMSSYMMVTAGHKRSLNISLDYVHGKQRLRGEKSINLLNCHDDDTFMAGVLYSLIANRHLPAPRVGIAKVVINGEAWGVYNLAEQFDNDFAKENFHAKKAARWKVPGSPMGQGGLEYLGEDVAKYKQRYAIKSKDNEADWLALIKLCKTLNETPAGELEAALKPMLDIEGTLRFLALDNALINCDGYWIRSSDYAFLRDDAGVFHMVPHDMNEGFRAPGGPGFGGGFGKGRGNKGKGNPDFAKGGPPPFGKDGPPPFGKDGPPPFGKDGPPPFGKAGPPDQKPGAAKGKGMFGGMFGGGAPIKGVELDPLHGLDDARKPLRSKLLKVPALRARYLELVRQIARQDLDWKTLGPVVGKLRQMMDADIKAETRGLSTYKEFQRTTQDAAVAQETGGRPGAWNLHAFAEQRCKYLLAYQDRQEAVSPGKAAAAGKTSR